MGPQAPNITKGNAMQKQMQIQRKWSGLDMADLLPAVVVFVLIALVGTIGAQILQSFGTSNAQLFNTAAQTVGGGKGLYQTAANTLTVTLSNKYSWISSQYPLTLTIKGYGFSAYASNTANAVVGSPLTETFSLTSPTATQVLASPAGNFFNITSVGLTVPSFVYPQAMPSVNASVTQNYQQEVTGSNTITSNSFTATGSFAVTATAAYNATTYGLSGVNTIMTYLPLIALVIVAAILIGIVLVAFAFRGGKEERF
jgi:hypothetical protein